MWCGAAPTPADWLARWNFDPAQIAILALALACAGLVARERRGMFLAAWTVAALLYVSPLCALTVAFFSARVAHHLLLVCVAAPLLAMALAPRRWSVGAAAAALIAAMCVWHLPAFYTLAYDTIWGYWAAQTTLLASATAFWRAAFDARARVVAPLCALVSVGGAMGFIGAVLTFAPRPLYAEHLLSAAPFGVTALGDQQLGGLLMWAPGALPFIAAAMATAMSAMRAAAWREEGRSA